MAKMTISFTLDTERDRRIVRWYESLPKRGKSEAIRKAIHAYLGKGGITLGDIYEAIQDLRRSGLVVAQASEPQQADVPADVLEKLGQLGL